MPAYVNEVFYLHINGEQRGPYTVRHIDHLLNSGLINEDALFWREGLEQWQPVTELVVRRQPKNHWGKRLVALAVALVIGLLLLRVFLPITLEGWREINQHEFTKKAAYWRARGVVRAQCVPPGALVSFAKLPQAAVHLQDGDGARVVLRGELSGPSGPIRPTSWQVDLHYDKARSEWSAAAAREIAAR